MRRLVVLVALVANGARLNAVTAASAQSLRGANVIQTPAAQWGSAPADTSLARLRAIGANTVAIVPFLYQPRPESDSVSAGNAVSHKQLRAAIHAARALHMHVLLKPHVWIPGTWAGAIAPRGSAAWKKWFASYTREVVALAAIAEDEDVDAFAIGVELRGTVDRPEWIPLIAGIRSVYHGRLTFVADNVQQAARVPFWNRLDFISVSLYPGLGTVGADSAMVVHMSATLDSLATVQGRNGKTVWVAEVGIRSAAGAQEQPWVSAEERTAQPDADLQARVLQLWLTQIARRQWIEGVLVWRWFTDPRAGSEGDTDFTVQGKAAEAMLRNWWTRHDKSHE